MKVFLFVIDFKKINLIDINVTNAANPEYCNISNPGLLEQKPGQEHGLTLLLYESFYDSSDCWIECMPCHKSNTRKAFLLCVF